MKRFFIILLSLGLNQFCLAQTSLTGYITIQNSNGQSAYPAQIKSFGTTDAVANQADGKFTLVYDKKQPGASATLKIERTGYEIVNRRDLRVTLPKNDKAQRPVKLFLCPKGQWRKYADQYYKTNIQQINKNYKKRLQKIQQQYEAVTLENAAYRQALFDLEEKRKAAESQAEEMAEKFAKTNLDDATDRTATAHRLFTAGKLDSVLLVLNEKEILADIKKAEQEIASGKEFVQIGKDKLVNGLEAKEKIVEEFMIKARAHIIKLQWGKAERSFEIATTADNSNFDNLFEYGAFLFEQNKGLKAEPIFQKCLKVTEDDLLKITVLNYLGLTNNINFEFKKSEASLLAALKMAEKYSASNKEILAYTLNNLGLVYKANNDFPLAGKYYSRSLALKKSNTSESDSDAQSDLAHALVNMANLHRDKYEFVKAEQRYDEALALFKKLANKNSDEYKYDLAYLLMNMGVFHFEYKQDFNKAEKYSKEALTIFKKLGEKNKQKYEPQIAAVHSNLGIFYLSQMEVRESESNTLEALKIFKKLAIANPQSHQFSVARNLSNLAMVNNIKGDYSDVEKMYLKAINIFQLLAKENPQSMTFDLSRSEFLYGIYCMERFAATRDGKYEKQATKWFGKAKKNLEVISDGSEKKAHFLKLVDDGYKRLNEIKNR